MNFNINKQKKKNIQKNMYLSRKSVRITYIIEKAVLLISLVGPLLYFIVNALSPTAYMGNIRGAIRKNYDVLILLTTLAMGMLLAAWILIRTLRIKLSSVHATERVEETIEITDGKLIYAFRIKFQTNFNERKVIVIELNSLEKMDYEIRSKKITISGKMIETCIDVNVDIEKSESRQLVIYDYFEPSLYGYLKTYCNKK